MASSRAAPIDVDRGSDGTLSSDSDVDMEPERHAQPRSRSVLPVSRTAAASPQEAPTATFSASMAAARDSLLTAVSVGGKPTEAPSARSSSAVTTNSGKKRRLSSPPAFRRSVDEAKKRSPLDFRLSPFAKPVGRTAQLVGVDNDEDEDDEDEETKTDSQSATREYGKVDSAVPRGIDTAGSGIHHVESVRTWVCGQWFGRCVLDIHMVYVRISVWSLPTADGRTKQEFNGSIQNQLLERFSLSRGEAPYFAILQLARRNSFEPAFSGFYDAIFARVTEQNGPSVVPDVYGLVLFFDDDLELARCQSLGDVSKTLRSLVGVPVSDEETTQVKSLVLTHSSPQRSSTGVLSMISGKVKGTIDMISNLFSPDRSPQKLRQSKLQLSKNEESDSDSTAMSSRFRTSSRRQSLLQQSGRDVEVVVQLSGDTDRESGDTGNTGNASDKRSTRGVMELLRQHQKQETQRLSVERRAKVLLSYPFEDCARPGQITITYGDIDRLKPGEFLNDSIIDFYLRYLWRHIEPWQQQQIYFFSSHFFTQLCGGKLSGSVSLSEERLIRLARWTQKENLFQKRFIFVPINDSCHWSIAVICNPGSAIVHRRRRRSRCKAESGTSNVVIHVDAADEPLIVDTTEDASDSEEEEALHKERIENPPCILFLDSLRCHQKKKICSLLKSYIEYEYKSRVENHHRLDTSQSGPLTTASFDIEAIRVIEPEVPLQSNSSDCGVFLLMYTTQILQRFPAGIGKDDVDSRLSLSMSKQMFDDGHVLEFRDYLHQLIFMLQKIERRGGNELAIKTEGLEFFSVENY